MTDEEIDEAVCEISREECPDGCYRYRDVLNDREALRNATWAIVESIRQLREAIKSSDKSEAPNG